MGKVLSFSDKKELRRDQITLLVKTYYDRFDYLRHESLKELTDRALKSFLDSDLTMDEINDKILASFMERKKAFDDRYDEENINKNHKEIYSRLEQVTKMLNAAGVDYQLAGALCGYLKYGEESSRFHEDLDFCVNEADFDKFREICLSVGLSFEDNRLKSPRVLENSIPTGEHEVIARDSESDFHIGVFPFERLADGTVISKGYYHDVSGESCVSEEIFLADAASEIYGHEEVDYNGTSVAITPPEYVYLLKSYTRNQKEIQDIEFMESRIDKDRLKKIEELLKDGKVVQNVPVSDVPDTEIHNPYSSSNDDINEMLMDDQSSRDNNDLENSDSSKKESSKVFVKKSNRSIASTDSAGEEGFINNAIVTTLGLIAFSLCAIGLIVTYLIAG